MRALVVDDNEVVCNSIAKVVNSLGIETDTASDGKMALGIFNRSPPDLLITDLHMPVMDGAALVRYVRDAKSLIPIFVITGEHDDVSHGIELLDRVIVLRKPLSEAQLIAAFRRSGIDVET